MQDIATTMAETESMWMAVCNGVDDDRVDMLLKTMVEQHGLLMYGESNSNAIMTLVGFMAQQVIALHEDGEMSIEGAMILLQIGMQRGVQAHVSARAKKGGS
jgi:hypothetical protein